MQVEKLTDRLWRWTARHPKWTPDQAPGWDPIVASHYVEAEDGMVVLVDPLVPDDVTDAARFWHALEEDLSRAGGEISVVLTCQWHGRSAREVRARTGATIHAHVDAASAVEADVTDPFAGTLASLPGGIRAHRLASCAGGEVALELPDGLGLLFGDVLLGVDGGVRICPTTWAAEPMRPTFQDRVREELRGLLGLRFERILVAHGEPVLRDAGEALEAALSAPPKGG